MVTILLTCNDCGPVTLRLPPKDITVIAHRDGPRTWHVVKVTCGGGCSRTLLRGLTPEIAKTLLDLDINLETAGPPPAPALRRGRGDGPPLTVDEVLDAINDLRTREFLALYARPGGGQFL